MVTATMAALLAVSFLSGYLVGRGDPLSTRLLPPPLSPSRGPAGQNGQSGAGPGSPSPSAAPPADIGRQFDPFWEAWNFVEREFVHQPIDRTGMVRGAIKGLVQSLSDGHASYYDPVANRIEKAYLDGIVEGIGASVELKERRLTILAPIEDGPAARLGLRSGDIVVKVDGRDAGTLTLAEATAMLRGPSGTKVRLVVQRPDEPDAPPVELEITRARIELETVSSRMVADGVGYVRIRVFGPQTVPQLGRALRDLRSRRVRGLILDLRDNPGGYIGSAVEVASQFVKDGKVVVFEERDGRRRPTYAGAGGLGTDLTVAVLVNRGTASASEIVAGALRDNDRGVLFGENTFGKGSVQQVRDLSDGSAVRVTTGTWLTPNGKTIEGQGLSPGFAVKPTVEDERARRDVVLERALEWFKATPGNATAGTPVPAAGVPTPETPAPGTPAEGPSPPAAS